MKKKPQIEKIFAELLTYYRESKSISKHELSNRSGIARSFIIRLEQGKAQPSLLTMLKISKALDTDPLKILSDIIKRKPDLK